MVASGRSRIHRRTVSVARRSTSGFVVQSWVRTPSRLPLTNTSVELPPKPRSDAVWLLNVCSPITLPSVTLPALLLAEIRFMISMAVVAPLRVISSRLIIWTGNAPSPSIRLMFEPVTSTLMSAARAI